MRQILVNLLSNPVKFTEAGGKITIRCRTTQEPGEGVRLGGPGPWAFVAVEDTGIGIAPDELDSVFQPFVQAEGGYTRTHRGTGLGLTISRQLARLMNGDLTGQSELGKGSVFTLWLPEPGSADGEASLQERGGVPRQEVLVEVGRALLDEVNGAMAALAARIRQDPIFPDTAGASDADLQDHGVAFLSDIAQSVVAWEDSEVAPSALLRCLDSAERISCRALTRD